VARLDGHGHQLRLNLLPPPQVNLSTVFAGQKVGVRQVSDCLWLVSFMDYDLGYFDDETAGLEPIQKPFAARVLPMPPE